MIFLLMFDREIKKTKIDFFKSAHILTIEDYRCVEFVECILFNYLSLDKEKLCLPQWGEMKSLH